MTPGCERCKKEAGVPRPRAWPLPVPFYQGAQAELLWRFAWDPRRSNLSATVAMLEGATGGDPHIDITTDPQGALAQLRARQLMRNTARARSIDKALVEIPEQYRRALRSAYELLPQPQCSDVFGRLANLLPESAHLARAHRGLREQLEPWLIRYCHRIRHGTPSQDDQRLKELARIECETRLADALNEYRRRRRG